MEKHNCPFRSRLDLGRSYSIVKLDRESRCFQSDLCTLAREDQELSASCHSLWVLKISLYEGLSRTFFLDVNRLAAVKQKAEPSQHEQKHLRTQYLPRPRCRETCPL